MIQAIQIMFAGGLIAVAVGFLVAVLIQFLGFLVNLSGGKRDSAGEERNLALAIALALAHRNGRKS